MLTNFLGTPRGLNSLWVPFHNMFRCPWGPGSVPRRPCRVLAAQERFVCTLCLQGGWEDPGGPGRSHEEPGGARRSKDDLGGPRRTQEDPRIQENLGGARRSQEDLRRPSRTQEDPGGSRSQEDSGGQQGWGIAKPSQTECSALNEAGTSPEPN